MASIDLIGLTKAFEGGDGALAVDHLDLHIDDGEFLVLVGPSGCGKTTSLRMVAGLEDISGGEIRLDGELVNDLTSRRRDVAMVFQNYDLYPHMTVFENMAFALEIRRIGKAEVKRRVTEAASVLDLTELLDRKPKSLSGGQRQRVAMGRAIVREPRAFLMDEPLSNLDAKLRVQMRAEIARLQRRLGVTTLYVTHDQTEAMTMADRVAVLRKGVLQQVASPLELYEEPANLFVAGFIGSPSMNLVTGRVADTGVIGVGSATLRPSDRWWQKHPGLAGQVGREIAVGMRPEDLRIASTPTEGILGSISVEVQLVELLGAEVYLHGRLDAPAVRSEEVRELAADVDATTAMQLANDDAGTEIVARCGPRTRAAIGDRVGLSVDVDRLHVFDLDTGASLRRT